MSGEGNEPREIDSTSGRRDGTEPNSGGDTPSGPPATSTSTIEINVKWQSTNVTRSLIVPSNASIFQVRQLLQTGRHGAPTRLIYGGRLLQDQLSLEDYSISRGATIFVTGEYGPIDAQSSFSSPFIPFSGSNQPVPQVDSAFQVSDPMRTNLAPSAAPFFLGQWLPPDGQPAQTNMSGAANEVLSGMPARLQPGRDGTVNNLHNNNQGAPASSSGQPQAPQPFSLMSPESVRQMLQLPVIQSLLDRPDFIRFVMDSNPQLRELRERNPELNHILNDPQLMRDSMDAVRNPNIMREMMRNTDRAMSNIESMPGGFNALRRMYQSIQEPIWEATVEGGAGLLGYGPDGGAGTEDRGSRYNLDTDKPPNTEALPNPWARRPAAAAPPVQQSGTAAPPRQPYYFYPTQQNPPTVTQANPWAGAAPFFAAAQNVQPLPAAALAANGSTLLPSPVPHRQDNAPVASEGGVPVDLVRGLLQGGSLGGGAQPTYDGRSHTTGSGREPPLQTGAMKDDDDGESSLYGSADESVEDGSTGGLPAQDSKRSRRPDTTRDSQQPTPLTADHGLEGHPNIQTGAPPSVPVDATNMRMLMNALRNMNVSPTAPAGGLDTSNGLDHPADTSALPLHTASGEANYDNELDTLSNMGFTNRAACLQALRDCQGNLDLAIDRLLMEGHRQ